MLLRGQRMDPMGAADQPHSGLKFQTSCRVLQGSIHQGLVQVSSPLFSRAGLTCQRLPKQISAPIFADSFGGRS